MDPPPEARSLIDKFREAHRPGQRPKPDAEPSNWIGDQPSFSRLGQDLFGGVAQNISGSSALTPPTGQPMLVTS